MRGQLAARTLKRKWIDLPDNSATSAPRFFQAAVGFVTPRRMATGAYHPLHMPECVIGCFLGLQLAAKRWRPLGWGVSGVRIFQVAPISRIERKSVGW